MFKPCTICIPPKQIPTKHLPSAKPPSGNNSRMVEVLYMQLYNTIFATTGVAIIATRLRVGKDKTCTKKVGNERREKARLVRGSYWRDTITNTCNIAPMPPASAQRRDTPCKRPFAMVPNGNLKCCSHMDYLHALCIISLGPDVYCSRVSITRGL